ncbi:hypothetical protein [Thiobacillus thioparus]|uniref:hypothetical protein n=1 Tax=Thiobacillus thioparus TaxID=931 RepID=UPI00036B55AE|nr:hypothetical protein [Thiobacillus thioparus]
MKHLINKTTQTVKKIGRDAYAVFDNATGKVVAVGTAAMVAAGNAMAVPPDYTSLTSAIDMSTTSAALLLAAAALIGVYILWKGATMIMGAFKGR